MNYISRKEAAEMLHVHPQTISNYIEAGIVRRDPNTAPTVVRVLLKDVEKLVPEAKELEELQNSVESYKETLKAEEKKLAETVKDVRREINDIASFPSMYQSRIQMILFIVRKMSELTDNPLTERETAILEEMLMFHELSDIADKHNLTRERIREIGNKAARRFNRFCVEGYAEKMRNLEAENARLKEEAEKNNKEIAVLDRYRKLDEAQQDLERVCSEEPAIAKEFLDGTLHDVGLTIRAYNCLRAGFMWNEPFTWRSLLKRSKKEIMRWRNLGPKSFQEIENLIHKYGFDWGAVDEYGNLKKPLTPEQIVLITKK